MRARLFAVFIDHPERFLTKDESLSVETCEHLCRQVGGEFLRVNSTNVAEVIAQTAQKYHITQVLLGQSQKSRWELFWQGSLVQQLVRYLKDVDLHVIATEKPSSKDWRIK
jgi:two-component system sensor histidine kinase KdpD